MTHTLVTPATEATYANLLQEVKDHLRETGTSADTVLTALILVAVGWVEGRTGRALLNQTWKLQLDEWPCGTLKLPRAPLSSVTSITYVDGAGATQTLATTIYAVQALAGDQAPRGTVRLKYGQVWPTLRGDPDGVAVTYVAGYGAATTNLPAALRMLITLRVEQLYAGQTDERLLEELVALFQVQPGLA